MNLFFSKTNSISQSLNEFIKETHLGTEAGLVVMMAIEQN